MSMGLNFRFVNRHVGAYREFSERYRTVAAAALEAGGQECDAFCSELVTMASDERNLQSALAFVRVYGGASPGPDGKRIVDLDRMDAWDLARDLRDRLRAGTFVRGPLRRCRVWKRLGSSEKRTIWVANLEDRVVARGAEQILVPLLDPVMDVAVYSWHRRGTQAALARAVHHTRCEGRTIWITQDLRNAFDEVPRGRLHQILRHYVPNDGFCRLVDHLTARESRRGILQGSSLSPALLDLYLGHVLHPHWRQADRHPPLISYVDDLWAGCRPGDDAVALYHDLAASIRTIGMRPKLGPERAIADLRSQAVTWLGYRLGLRGDQLCIRSAFFAPAAPAERRQTHERLVAKFAGLHDRPLDRRSPNDVLRGIIGYLAPTLPFEYPQRIYDWISEAAAEAGFREIWSFDEVLAYWQIGHERWTARLNALSN